MKFCKDQLRLYAVTDSRWLGEGETLSSRVAAAIRGGATFVQLREKEMQGEKLLSLAREIGALCRGMGVPFVVDDDAEIAALAGADGVHVGQSDESAAEARRRIGPDKILGVSAQTVEQALLAESRGADYLGVGAVFATGSKADASEVDHETVKAICQAVHIPVIAIGGITGENVGALTGTGVCGVAVISAIFASPDRRKAAEELKAAVQQAVAQEREPS